MVVGSWISTKYPSVTLTESFWLTCLAWLTCLECHAWNAVLGLRYLLGFAVFLHLVDGALHLAELHGVRVLESGACRGALLDALAKAGELEAYEL